LTIRDLTEGSIIRLPLMHFLLKLLETQNSVSLAKLRHCQTHSLDFGYSNYKLFTYRIDTFSCELRPGI
jgi:hypothetical protein